MGKKTPPKTQRTISAIKSTMSCSKIHTDQKKKKHKKSELLRNPNCRPRIQNTHTHTPQAHEEIVDPRDRAYSHQGWKIASWIPSLLLPTHPRVFFSPKSLSQSLWNLPLNSASVQPSSSQPPNSFAAAHGSLTSSLTKKIAVVGLEEKDRSRGPGRTRLPDY
jgi:hypothetical protein